MSFLDSLSDFACTIVQLAQEKLTGLKGAVYRLCVGLAIQMAGVLVLVFSIVMFFLATFWAIQSVLGGTLAALLTGAGALVVALGLIAVGSWRAK